MVKKEEIIEKVEETEEQKEEVKKTKSDKKEGKKSKKLKDAAKDLDEILYEKEQVDLGETPEFLSLGKNKKQKKEEIPNYLKY